MDDGWMDGGMEGGMDGWVDGWMDGWMDGWNLNYFIFSAPKRDLVKSLSSVRLGLSL